MIPEGVKRRRCARDAKAIVDRLLREELIVLVPREGARARLEERLVGCLRNEIFHDVFAAERLIGVLVESEEVEEVFADERAAHQALGTERFD